MVKAKSESFEETIKREYSDFLYAVSHDLAAPIRHVNSFARILESQLSGSLDEKQEKYLHHIIAGSTQLSEMLSGLLALSRLNTQEFEVCSVDLGLMIPDIIKSLKEDPAHAEASFILEPDPLPTVIGDRGQLEFLFTELLENALKFHREGVRAEIGVKAEETDTHWVFLVTDNGTGLDEKFSDKVFEVFARGPECSHIKGVGIGLHIVRRIVERHGGDIFLAETEPYGLQVRFTLAKEISTSPHATN